MSTIALVGGGAWGTALASVLGSNGTPITLYLRSDAISEEINTQRSNRAYLGNIALSASIKATTDLSALKAAQIILVVVPTQKLRPTFQALADQISPDCTLILCAKGLEQETGRRVSEIAREALPNNPIAILSGPSFASDVAKGLPTAVTLAAETIDKATDLAEKLSRQSLRLYACEDIIGVELGGALKNVIALGVGMVRGRGLGSSAEAALTTRGFMELGRIARHFGASFETLTGLSGLGDLVLTCSGTQSRNFTYGLAVGRGDSLDGLKLAEGAYTTAIAANLCATQGIDAPIISAIDAVLSNHLSLDEAMVTLMSRPLKAEGA